MFIHEDVRNLAVQMYKLVHSRTFERNILGYDWLLK